MQIATRQTPLEMASKLANEFDGTAAAEALMRSWVCGDFGDTAAEAYWLKVKDVLTGLNR